MLTGAASAPWRPSHAGAGITKSRSQDREGLELSATNVGTVTQGRGFRSTKCYPSVGHSISRHFAIDFFLFSRSCGVPKTMALRKGPLLLVPDAVDISVMR